MIVDDYQNVQVIKSLMIAQYYNRLYDVVTISFINPSYAEASFSQRTRK